MFVWNSLSSYFILVLLRSINYWFFRHIFILLHVGRDSFVVFSLYPHLCLVIDGVIFLFLWCGMCAFSTMSMIIHTNGLFQMLRGKLKKIEKAKERAKENMNTSNTSIFSFQFFLFLFYYLILGLTHSPQPGIY